MARRLGIGLAVVVAAGMAAAPVRAGIAPPVFGIEWGRTFAVASDVDGAFDQGGFQVGASFLWPWEDRFRFGINVFAADLGDLVERVVVIDPTDGSEFDYGTVEVGHLDSWGVQWRADATGPRLGGIGRSFARLSYGFVRLEADDVGEVVAASSAVQGGIAVGLEREFSSRHALGLSAGATWLSDEFTRHYGTASLEWRWRWRAP